MHNINQLVFYFINDAAGNYLLLDRLMVFSTSYLAYFISILILAYYAVWVPFRSSDIRERLKKATIGFEMVVSVFLVWFIITILKNVVGKPRPFEVIENINVLLDKTGGDSFPSGHAGLTFAVATMVFFYNKKLGIVLGFFAVMIATSRIYVGVHYPVDVFVGGMLGFIVSALVHIFFQNKGSFKIGNQK